MPEKLPFMIGPYLLNRRIGRGGMGTVYGGTETKNGQSIAVKVLSGSLSEEVSFRQRFAKEIEAMRQLKHPNIVQLFGYGQEDETFFYSMELVDGNSLEEEIHQKNRRFTWQETLIIAIQIASALQLAHNHGIIHRDLKPGNLLLSTGGVVKLSDFGIASLFGSTRLTDVGNVIGTIEYMSPEQATQQPVTPRSDLYSLGAVLVALLCGRPPFSGKNLLEIVHQHASSQAKRPSQFGIRIPIDFDLLIGRLLDRDQNKRPKNAQVVCHQLNMILQKEISEQKRDDEESSLLSAEKTEEDALDPLRKLNVPFSEKLSNLISGSEAATVDYPNESSIWYKQFSLEENSKKKENSDVLSPDFLSLLESTKKKGDSDAGGDIFGAGDKNGENTSSLSVEENINHTENEKNGEYDEITPENPASEKEKTVRAFYEVGKAAESPSKSPMQQFSDSPWVGLILVLISSGLFVGIAVLLRAWWLSPPPADVLFDRISHAAQADSISDAYHLNADIQIFLKNYEQDYRVKNVREIEASLELDQLERRLRSSSRGNDYSAVEPVERDYRNIMAEMRQHPEECLQKLEAFVILYKSEYAHFPIQGKESQGRTRKNMERQLRQYVRLAERQIDRINSEIANENLLRDQLLERQLAVAKECIKSEDADDSEYGKCLFHAIFKLYSEYPWAEKRLKSFLTEIEEPEK